VHHRLHARADLAEFSQPQQIEGSGTEGGHRTSAIALLMVGVILQLGVKDPVLAFNTPSDPHQLQQGFWRSAQAGVAPKGAPGERTQMGGVKGLAIMAASGGDFNDPAGADTGLLDVLGRLLGPQRPGDVAAMADLLNLCHKRDLALSLELAANLTVQCLLVALILRRSLRLDYQEEAGLLLLELPKNGRWVWGASTWITTPSRSSSPSSCRSTASSWFSPVA